MRAVLMTVLVVKAFADDRVLLALDQCSVWLLCDWAAMEGGVVAVADMSRRLAEVW